MLTTIPGKLLREILELNIWGGLRRNLFPKIDKQGTLTMVRTDGHECCKVNLDITQHAQWTLNRIENTFNGTFTG